MNYIRFELAGLINSFRIPTFKTYHKSYLAPTRTTLLGLIANISGYSEHDYYELLDKDIQVSVVIDNLAGEVKDLWIYKSMGNNHGRSPLRRSKNYKPQYTVYLAIADTNLLQAIHNSLLHPQRIPSLGMDDEMVAITNITILEHTMVRQDCDVIHSVVPYSQDTFLEYDVLLGEKNKTTIYPQDNAVVTRFSFDSFNEGGRSVRNIGEIKNVKEFYNVSLKLHHVVQVHTDTQRNVNIMFY